MTISEIMAKAHFEDYFGTVLGCCEPSWNDYPRDQKFKMRSAMAAAIAALEEAGFVIAPKEPTEDMTTHGKVKGNIDDLDPTRNEVKLIYKAMLAAAPSVGETGNDT